MQSPAFESINRGYNSVFQPDQLSIGLVVPIEHYPFGPVPTMKEHLERAKRIDALGFKALWLRDIPLHVPSFGDAGQCFEPFTYLGYLAAHTKDIALGIASIALPLHHPLHVAKAAATVDQLSEGRMILGVASGDRPDEYPAMGISFEQRGALFRKAFAYLREAQQPFPQFESDDFGVLTGSNDILPKATGHKLPLLLTGSSRQTLEWNAQNTDGWMNYPRNPLQQAYTIAQWRELIAKTATYDKPFMQPLYIDLQKNADFRPQPIHLGLKLGVNYLIEYLHQLKEIGVNHLALNLRFNTQDINHTLDLLAEKVLPAFHSQQTPA